MGEDEENQQLGFMRQRKHPHPFWFDELQRTTLNINNTSLKGFGL